MPCIKKLSLDEIQKIAAGEVIERPSHIVKELVENALDAHATEITVTIKNGGRDLIRVMDNGIGLDSEDAVLCFEHHATSKIKSFYDIETVMTHGFRGEALTTIAAVSTVTLTTKMADTWEGTKVTVHNGIVQEITACAHTQGTTVTVTHLFDAVPVRKKFLKSRETEIRHIHFFMRACALIHPDKDFTLVVDDTRLLECRGLATIKDRALIVFDDNVRAEQIVTIDRENKYGCLEGIITNHHTYRYDSSALFFFVNKRWIKNHHIARALMRGYGSVLPPGRYPLCALSLSVKTSDVDINSHPRKEEVRFLHVQGIESLIKESVTAALETNVTRTLSVPVPPLKPFPFSAFFSPESKASITNFSPDSHEVVPFLKKHDNAVSDVPVSAMTNDHIQMPCIATTPDSYTLIGQLHATYILLEHEKGLSIIDQHAAHERILYEHIAHTLDRTDSVQLLFPVIVSLSADLYKEIMPYCALFTEHGVIVEPFGERCLKISAVPPYLKNVDWEIFLSDCAANFIHERHHGLSAQEVIHRITHTVRAQMACKGAVKAGDTLTVIEMEKIINDLAHVDNRFSCPHGRPTTFLYSLYELEKKFRRVGT